MCMKNYFSIRFPFWNKLATVILMTMFLLVSNVDAFSASIIDNIRGVQVGQIPILGSVKDSQGEPLMGATILVKGTSNGAMTDLNGEFHLSVANEDVILVISYVGMTAQEILVGKRTVFDIILLNDSNNLDEVVVIGYGSTTKKELTGSVASLKSEDFNKGDRTDPMGLLQGKVAGLSIVNAQGGDPNQTAEFMLRGASTLSGGASPLVVVDGVPGVSLNSVSPSSISSIDVLKDGSAAAIYGTRGTNGVIIITTKKAIPGEAKVEFSTYLSTQSVVKKLDNLTAEEFRNTLSIKFPGSESSYDYNGNTDWFDEITRVPYSYNSELSLTGGSVGLSYRASVNYHDNKGLVMKNGLSRLNTSLSVNQKGLNDRLNVVYKIAYSTLDREKSDTWALQQAFRYNPTEPVYDDSNPISGGYSLNSTPFEYYNPVAMINERDNVGTENYFTGSLDASFEIFDGFKVGALVSLIRNNTQNSEYRSRFYPIALGTNGEAYKQSLVSTQDLLELRAEYSKVIDKHKIQGFVGYSYQGQSFESFSARNKGFDMDSQSYNNLGAGNALLEGSAQMSSYKESSKLIGFYGRLMYNYDSKYLFSASIRREGSSKFGANHKWGLFTAASLGWVMTGENFMSNVKWVNYLKIRAGYGVTGNQEIDNYLSLQLLQSDPYYKVLNNGEWINTYAPTSNENPDLKWEEKEEFDIGFDFSLLDSKITGTLDYYNRNTNDLLWWYNVPVPPNLYPQTYDNVGKINNQGIEFGVDYKVIDKVDFSWTTNLNYSKNKNKLVSFSNSAKGYEMSKIQEGFISTDLKTYTIDIVEGEPLGNFVGPVFLGIGDDGNSIFKDVDGDGTINQEVDRELIGNAYPAFQLSWGNTFKYKNFDLDIFFRGVFGQEILNYHRMYYDNFAYFGSKNILASALENINYIGAAEYSSRYIEDGSYIKLDNVTLGYNFKSTGTFKSIRFYVSGQQLLTITNYKGADPEVSIAGLSPGIDNYSYYPRVKTYTIGINATF